MSPRHGTESTFEQLLETAPDAMVIVDEAGEIELVNAQAERLFGYDRHELLGRPVEQLIPQRLRDQHESHREDYYAQPTARPMGDGLILHARNKDGHEFPVEISLGSLQTDRLLVSAAIRDVTERLRSETEARERDARIAKAESELARHRLARRQAAEIHDNIIQGTVLAKYAIEDDRIQDALKAIDTTLAQAKHIVDELHRADEIKPGDLRREQPAELD